MPTLSEVEARAQLLSRILDVFHSNRWNDIDDFSIRLTTEFMTRRATTKDQVEESLKAVSTTFFQINHASLKYVATALIDTLGNDLPTYTYAAFDRVTLTQILPEITRISDRDAELRLNDFQGDERILQNNLRQIFRKKEASLPKRTHDSSKEVADIEKFLLNINGKITSFTVVVKGYKSTGGKSKLTWADIAHQVTKARRANPDHILVVSAMEPVDELITNVEEYNIDIGRPGCVIFVPPIDMTRIMISNGY